MLQNTRLQHGVGQGFFHTGEVTLSTATPSTTTFRYIYDCGSDDVDTLLRCVDEYSRCAADGATVPVDALFVSHLDRDHINGLDRLLNAVQVETVFLPYLTPYERLTLVAEALDDGPPPGDVIEFSADPVRWLGDHGVARVISVQGRHGPEGTAPVEPVPPDERPPDHVQRLGLPLGDLRGRRRRTKPSGGYIELAEVYDETAFPLVANDQTLLNWTFVTFVHPEHERVDVFRQRVKKDLGISLREDASVRTYMSAVLGVLREPTKRDCLAACYNEIRRNRNLTSMSLYSGPSTIPARAAVECNAPDRHWGIWRGSRETPRCGWLGTGDANLKALERRLAFLDHYRAFLGSVLTLTLPHHGSWRNFHDSLLDHRPVFCVASAGQNSRHMHPSETVCSAVAQRPAHLVRVTENPMSAWFKERVELA